MPVDQDLAKWLNLVRASPLFVLKDKADGGANVLRLERVPENDGFYWIHGQTTLPTGRILVSVFHVDTDSHGEICAAYWWIDGHWVSSQDPNLEATLGPRESVFPFAWEFTVPLEGDIHQP